VGTYSSELSCGKLNLNLLLVSIALYRWQERLREDPSNFETLGQLPGVMSDVLKEHYKMSNDYVKRMSRLVSRSARRQAVQQQGVQ
jgi:hypothetical protein